MYQYQRLNTPPGTVVQKRIRIEDNAAPAVSAFAMEATSAPSPVAQSRREYPLADGIFRREDSGVHRSCSSSTMSRPNRSRRG